MKPTEQTKFSLFYPDGKRATYGNCLVANIASILELSIHEVPNVYVFYGMEKKETPTQSQYVIMRGLSPKKEYTPTFMKILNKDLLWFTTHTH
jgi:hypothetical protein